MLPHPSGLHSLPIELLYEIQLYALSPFLPYLSHYLSCTFNESPISFRVQYLLAACTSINKIPLQASDVLSKALRYSLCTPSVLDSLCSKLDSLSKCKPALIEPLDRMYTCELPRRLFRSLTLRSDGRDWHVGDEPLPFLKHIFNKGTRFPILDPNSLQGYALTRAVHARHKPLIQFLLDIGAWPACKGGMAIKVAIKQKNLEMVKMLVERAEKRRVLSCTTLAVGDGGQKHEGKRRGLEGGLEFAEQSMLKLAVKCNARDIIDYLAREKGIIPDMETLNSLRL
ncbi:hypothetical protein AGABI2DRAFT_201079 [Agaricus bisporus var. bisporus H97]|uniref:hypothetical protein n=1 Tax=Agaricus bisporus var. bisporus (strain H97 / ATCC MYA-4626 / FGSC 10389) TaxID=936046 RepID=UPI00029F596F|nr:hypothetical protein AGABI2DRAFT_201079 [Agaricus bisporus var. bisporus H97]EKV49028.1 hypothetical protein AGABI2DRAFT_201079 [Agaricus bisporus var. bisporus H97]